MQGTSPTSPICCYVLPSRQDTSNPHAVMVIPGPRLFHSSTSLKMMFDSTEFISLRLSCQASPLAFRHPELILNVPFSMAKPEKTAPRSQYHVGSRSRFWNIFFTAPPCTIPSPEYGRADESVMYTYAGRILGAQGGGSLDPSA